MTSLSAHDLAQLPTPELMTLLRDRDVSCESFDTITGILAGRMSASRPPVKYRSID